MTTSKGKEIIDSEWKAAGILAPIDPSHNIDPTLDGESESSNCHLLALCDVTAEEFELLCGKKLGPEKDDAVTDNETGWKREEAEL